MSAKGMYYHFLRKKRAEQGLPIFEPRPSGLSPYEVRSKKEEQFVVKLFKPIDANSGGNWNVYNLKVGAINQSFSNYMKSQRYHNAYFVSAWDPYENPNGDLPNQTNHNRLKEHLMAEGLVHAEAKMTQVRHLGWYANESQCFVIFNVAKQQADHIADRFYQNTYASVPNPMGYLKLEVRQPIRNVYLDTKNHWLSALNGVAYEAARRLSLDSISEIMMGPESEELHWLVPDLRDLNQPWPLATPRGDLKGVGTEWDRLSKLHKAATWEAYAEINSDLTPIK
jgi:hypothetical protein